MTEIWAVLVLLQPVPALAFDYLRRFAHAAAPAIHLVGIEDLALKIAAFNFDFLVWDDVMFFFRALGPI